MERKAQQQTLSIRISDALREFLERSKQVISSGRGESVSTSDVAKILLESAKDDRLDYRLEVADLQQSPTEALSAIRRKWDAKQDLSRAEWIFLGQYIMVACEEVSEDPAMPGPDSFASLLEALLAVRRLRIDRGIALDRYYLGNLGAGDGAAFNDRQLDPEVVSQVAQKCIQDVRESRGSRKPVFAGRSFYVAVRDEELPDLVALNRTLLPYMSTLFRLAARGHWMREHRPVRSRRESPAITETIPAVSAAGFRLTFTVSGDGEVSILVSMDAKDVAYPLAPYPEIREFVAMLDRLKSGQAWSGVHFRAWVTDGTPEKPARFYFCRHRDGITFGFSPKEWHVLKALFAKALGNSKLERLFEELSLVYGEL
jgi:hypothetical protein